MAPPEHSPSPLEGPITRRDFVNGVLVGVGSALLGATAPGCAPEEPSPALPSLDPDDWYGYGGVGDYRLSHGNTPEAVDAAHRIRDGEFEGVSGRIAPTEEYDLVIVGAGMAGLGAALEYSNTRRPGQSCLILDNHPVFGGEAKENAFDVGGTRLIAPQGANGFFVPPPVGEPERATGDARYYAELGVPRELEYAGLPEDTSLRFCQDNYGYLVRGLQENTSVGHFFRTGSGGRWAVDMWRERLEDTPLAPEARRTLLAWYEAGAARSFDSDEAARRWLDSMSYRQFLEGELGMGPEAADYADLFLASA